MPLTQRENIIKYIRIAPFVVFYFRLSLPRNSMSRRRIIIGVLPVSLSSNDFNTDRVIWISNRIAFAHSLKSSSLYRFVFRSLNSCERIERYLYVRYASQRLNRFGEAFVTRLCFFNMFSNFSHIGSNFIIEGIFDVDAPMITVEHAHIAMLKSSLYSECDLSVQIRQFFSTSRLISVGDVFAVENIRRMYNDCEVVFFKVISVDRRGEIMGTFLIDSTQSALYQVSTICAPVPYLPPKCFIPEPLRNVASRLYSLINAHTSVYTNRAISILLSGIPGSGRKLLLTYLASIAYLNVIDVDCLELWTEVAGASEAKIKAAFHRAASYEQFCLIIFSNIDVIGLDPITSEVDCRVCACMERCVSECHARAIVFICDRRCIATLNPSLRSLFLYEIDVPNLEEQDRAEIFVNGLSTPNDVDIQSVARHTSGFVLAELHAVIADALYCKHATNSEILLTEHIEWAIDVRNQSFADSIGAPRIPNVSWDDIGGLADVKAIICESLEMSLRGGKGLKRSGVILYGPPGCGKTLTAKAVASEFKVTFLSVKGPELLNKYVGQSECNVRKVFERARLASPCVVFFDELDSLAPNRGRSGDSAGVADRIVSQLLSELDSLGDSKIFVLGATNRPDLLDPSLLMPGRFDKLVRVDGGVDAETKERVLRAVSRNVNFAADVDLSYIARQCSGWMSGADLYAIIARATMHAIRVRVEQIETGIPNLVEKPIVITNEDLSVALNEVSSSFSRAEFVIYNSMDTFA